MDHYTEIKISSLKRENEDRFTEFCFSRGAEGTSENLVFTQEADNYAPQTHYGETLEMSIYFSRAPAPSFFEDLRGEFPEAQFQSITQENKDWLEEWKKGFKPFELCTHFWVVPSWCEVPAEAKEVIKIDPGMAFGTGTHDTTQLAAGLLSELPTMESLIDVGTGTGILAILAKMLGWKTVDATEIDDDARRVAGENCELNNREIMVFEHQIEEVVETYDLVVANIIDGILVSIQEELKKSLKPKGMLLLTGILEEREPIFMSKFNLPVGYEIKKRVVKGEWVGLLVGPK